MARGEPFDVLVETILRGGGSSAVWGRHHGAFAGRRGFDEHRFRRALRRYWGTDADAMRVSLAVQDGAFVAGVVRMVGEHLALGEDDRRRVATAALRRRVLGEPDPTLDDVDAAWRAWWPPPPGDEGRERLAQFLRAWRSWLAGSTA